MTTVRSGAPATGDPSGRPSARWILGMSLLGAVSLGWLLAWVVHDSWGTNQLDFSVYVLGAHHLVDGQLYHVGLPYRPFLPFTYPPAAALVFWPLTVLSHQAAQAVWAVVNMASLYGIIALSLRAVRPDLHRVRLWLWAAVLLGPAYQLDPVRLTLYFGQINLVLCLLLLADLTRTLTVGGRTLPRGVLVGCCAAVKLVPLIFIPYLFLTRQVRAGWTALGTFVGLSAVAALVDPATSWAYWTRYANDAARVGSPWFILNQSLEGALDRLAHHPVSSVVIDAAGAVVIVAGLALARWAWRASSPFLGIVVCATTGMVASPITWEHHLVWAVPILIWLAWAADRPAGGMWWALGGAAWLWLAPLVHVPSDHDRELHEHGWTIVAADKYFWWLLAFLLGVAVLLTVRRARGGGPVRAVASPTASTAAPT